ncbi:exportin-6-B isoform X2 [Agrilus planipennis]|uniref:Exportin-6-B isoform X2 n=1 Tax=Agrilus planipennis TaxID=224129 RepID=A0A1W4XHQ8_AGRPL|nr:exportin-6-B isoform X2 [Agrilus planipennis]
MTQSENDSLRALERLLDEFFNHSTSNEKKREIENQLHSFSNQRDCWKYCIYFLAHTSSQYVSMYSISTIESVINRQWVSLDWEHRVQLKSALYSYLVEQDVTSPHFLRNKLAKLLVDIARFDWPHFYPEFFNNILQFLQSEQGQMLGLTMLRITSEELMNPRPDLNSYRKEELHRLLQQHIPQVFQMLCNILEELGKRPRHSATATPPPSPTHPSSVPDLTKELTAASFRPDNKDITKEALAATQHIFSWVNLTQVPLQLIRSIFHFTNISSYAQDDDDMCVLAMSTLNELLYRKCAPPDSQNLFIELYHLTVQLLRDIMSPNSDKIETLGNEYSQALLGLVTAVLNKMQFTYNRKQLDEVDSELGDDEEETEWQFFLKTSIEIIAMVAEYNPQEVFNQVLIPWKGANDIYCVLENAVDHKNLMFKIEISETERLHCVLRDFASLTQTLARLSTFFIDDNNEYNKNSAPIIDSLVHKLIESSCIATNSRFYLLKIGDSKLVECFAEAHSQLLASLKPWLSWFLVKGGINNLRLTQLLEVCLPILSAGTQNPKKVNHAAAHLLLTLTNTVFPPVLIMQPSVVEFIHVAPSLKFASQQTKEVIDNAICNVLIRPWGELSQADANQRNFLISVFFDKITKDFRELSNDTYENKVREVVGSTLPSLAHVIQFSKNHPNSSKKLLYMGLKASIDHALDLFPEYAKYPEVSDNILALFLEVLGVLQQQFGVENTRRSVEVFLEVAISQQQSKNLSGLDKLLQILQLVVEAPGPPYRSFLPGILQLCLEHVHPLVISQANDQPGVIIALLTLLHSIFLHRWQYFYVSQVRLGHSPGCSDTDPSSDTPQHPIQLLAVLQVFGQTLLQPDINVFRTSLAALEDLNSKWKLYYKTLFREQLLNQFLTVLFHTLLDKTHALLTDDILLAIYNMAAVNFQDFFESFIPNFLQSTNGLAQPQKDSLKQCLQKETDMPTFVQHIIRFVNDMRCYRLCNASLPPGSVIL